MIETRWTSPRRLTDRDLETYRNNPDAGLLGIIRTLVIMWQVLPGPWWARLLLLPLSLVFGAWTTPNSLSVGTRITAAIWNTYIVDNLNYLKTTIDNSLLWADLLTKTTLSNSTTETTVATKSVSANALGANGGFIYEFYADVTNSGASPRDIIFRLKFGSTTVLALTQSLNADANPYHIRWRYFVRNNAATNAQIVHAEMEISNGANSQTALRSATKSTMTNTASEDTTGALNAVLTMQMGTAEATFGFTAYPAVFYGPIPNA